MQKLLADKVGALTLTYPVELTKKRCVGKFHTIHDPSSIGKCTLLGLFVGVTLYNRHFCAKIDVNGNRDRTHVSNE